MYMLYDMLKRERIFASTNELDVLCMVGCKIKKEENFSYLIKKHTEEKDELIVGIRSEKDYENYKKYFEYRELTKKSAYDLKREMLDLAEKGREYKKRV